MYVAIPTYATLCVHERCMVNFRNETQAELHFSHNIALFVKNSLVPYVYMLVRNIGGF